MAPSLSGPVRKTVYVVWVVLGSTMLAEGAVRIFASFAPIEREAVLSHVAFRAKMELLRVGTVLGQTPIPLVERNTQFYPHPFVGYVARSDVVMPCGPGWPREWCVSSKPPRINSLGLYTDVEFPNERKPDEVIVAITGGSLANMFGMTALDVLERELARQEPFRGKSVRAVNLAVPGYKQPQQMALIAFLLSIGSSFDFVVNIDGLNELWETRYLNLGFKVFYAYPTATHWALVIDQPLAIQASDAQALYPKVRLETLRNFLIHSADIRPLSYSMFYRFFVELSLENIRSQLVLESQKSAQMEKRGLETIKKAVLASSLNERCKELLCVQEEVDLWQRSSEMLHQLLKANSIQYIHIIQPNQYMTDPAGLHLSDRRLRRPKDFQWDAELDKAAKLLRGRVLDLGRRGVRVMDFNEPYIFAGAEKGVFVDHVGHLNAYGNVLLAKAIARVILEDLRVTSR